MRGGFNWGMVLNMLLNEPPGGLRGCGLRRYYTSTIVCVTM